MMVDRSPQRSRPKCMMMYPYKVCRIHVRHPCVCMICPCPFIHIHLSPDGLPRYVGVEGVLDRWIAGSLDRWVAGSRSANDLRM
jgi:hypothetical protein